MKKIIKYFIDMKIVFLAFFFFLFTYSIVFRSILSILFEKKALWYQESFFVLILWNLFEIFPIVFIASGILFLVIGIIKIKASKPQMILLILTIISFIFSVYFTEFIYAAIVFFICYLFLEKSMEIKQEKEMPILIPMSFVGYFFLLFCLGSIFTSLLEAFIVISKFSDNLFPSISFFRYLGITISLSVAFSLKTTFIASILLQVFLIIIFLVRKYLKLQHKNIIFLFLLFHTATFSYFLYIMIVKFFGDPINALSLSRYAPLVIIVPLLFMSILTWISIKYMSNYTNLDISNIGNIYFNILLCFGLFYFIPIVKGAWKKIYPFLTLLGYTIFAIFLVYSNYPVISDFSADFCLIFSFMVIISAVAVFFIIFYNLKIRLSKISMSLFILFLITSMFICTQFYKFQNVRMLIHEYSKISWAQLQLIKTMIPQEKKIGHGKDTTFEFRPKIYDKFPEPKMKFEKKPPIFIVLLDALRPDHTNLMNYNRNTTPNIAEIAKEGIFFNNAYSCASATSTSLRHIFSSKYSSRFMLEKEKLDPFWLQELILSGYNNFVLNTFDSDYNGISLDGFLRKIPKKITDKANFTEIKTYEEFDKVDDALEILKKIVAKNKQDGLFTYLHFCRPHIPWMPTNLHFGTTNKDRYDATIKEADEALGIFIKGIKKLGLYDDAIIVILADHGTGLMEHGRYGGFLNYEEQIRIPLLIRTPETKKAVIDDIVLSIDLGPTLVNLVSDIKENRFHGISLLELMRGKKFIEERKYVFSLSAFEDLYSLIDNNGYKFHYHRRYDYYKLYDLKNDPKEIKNLADTHPELVKKYFEILDMFLRAGNQRHNNPYHYKQFNPKDFW